MKLYSECMKYNFNACCIGCLGDIVSNNMFRENMEIADSSYNS